jgi:hypothetical protein
MVKWTGMFVLGLKLGLKLGLEFELELGLGFSLELYGLLMSARG